MKYVEYTRRFLEIVILPELEDTAPSSQPMLSAYQSDTAYCYSDGHQSGSLCKQYSSLIHWRKVEGPILSFCEISRLLSCTPISNPKETDKGLSIIHTLQ